jgi:peptidoglycan/LPS O-acetylase OafA/YrhL
MPGLDLLRIAAGLALVVCHAGFLLAAFAIPDTVWMLIGHVGVEFFLVSYGFLLAEQSLKSDRSISILRQWARAALRLLPLYLVFLLCNYALLPDGVPTPSWSAYLTLTQNLAWPHPPFFGEAWIVAAAFLVALVVPLVCRVLHQGRFAAGLLCLLGLLLLTLCLRGLVVWTENPAFDSGVRKILITRLDLPVYGVLAAWLWIHGYEFIMRWRGTLALIAVAMLVVTGWTHLHVALDTSMSARIFLFTLCDVAWLCLMPWVCSLDVADAIARPARIIASSAYAGLLTHVTVLRLLQARGVSFEAGDGWSGILMLLSVIVLAVGIALLVRLALDRPLIDLRDRRLPRNPQHPVPVAGG